MATLNTNCRILKEKLVQTVHCMKQRIFGIFTYEVNDQAVFEPYGEVVVAKMRVPIQHVNKFLYEWGTVKFKGILVVPWEEL
jgi:hypothetical protein